MIRASVEATGAKSTEAGEKFLLAEYTALSASFWRNEETGEKRVNYLITLVTAVLAALVTLATKQGALSDAQIAWTAFAACLALLAVGILTFLRMLRRNAVTDEYKHALDEIRDRFRRLDGSALLEGYEPFIPAGRAHRRLGRGGLAELVGVVNSVVAASAAAAVASRAGSVAAVAAAMTAAFALSVVLHAVRLRRGPRRARPREIESALVVCSEAPGEVLDAVAALTGIAGLELRPRPDEAIRDRYFDTPDGRLGAREVALRVREVDGRTLLALKGPTGPGEGGEGRDELEEDWLGRAWETLRSELGRDVALPAVAPADDPVEALRLAGLELVQERHTARRVRDVVPPGGGRRLAELAVDTVDFRVAGQPVRHHEVEVEAKAPEGAAAVPAVVEALAGRFWPALRPWPYGKLPTGKAVEALLAERGPEGLLDDGGALLPAAYDAVAERLG